MRRRLWMSTAWAGVASGVIAAVIAGAGTLALAEPLPYDESADASAEVQQALSASRADHRDVLVVFGANWCEDCRSLDRALKSDSNAALVAHEFRVVKVDVGRFNKNLALDEACGHPIKKGIPAAVVLSPDDQVLYATKAGELSNARRMSDTGVYDFFDGMARTAKAQHAAQGVDRP